MFLSAKLPLTLAAVAVCAVAVTVSPANSASPQLAPRAQTNASTAAASAGSYTSHVLGSFGRAGTARGHFVPLRSFVRGGVAMVQGDLTTTLRRADGHLVGRVHRHDVTLPVKAPGGHLHAATATSAAATCSILHLVLGPLDLNLLGLKVHLNRVVLDITAQSGPGNLLGNLLCAVAHLLDGTSPTLTDLLRLSTLLNRIIGILT